MTRAEFETDLRREGYEIHQGELPPHTRRQLHAHDHDTCLFVLDGHFTLVLGQDRVTYGPGATWIVPAGTVHAEHTEADGVRYVYGTRPAARGASAR
jgi:quercetin dioxygenase-like cupin family protein